MIMTIVAVCLLLLCALNSTYTVISAFVPANHSVYKQDMISLNE